MEHTGLEPVTYFKKSFIFKAFKDEHYISYQCSYQTYYPIFLKSNSVILASIWAFAALLFLSRL